MRIVIYIAGVYISYNRKIYSLMSLFIGAILVAIIKDNIPEYELFSLSFFTMSICWVVLDIFNGKINK